jgi:hypothetical protein
MVDLTLGQWGICLGFALTLVVVEEVIKVFLRRQRRGDAPTVAEPARAAA